MDTAGGLSERQKEEIKAIIDSALVGFKASLKNELGFLTELLNNPAIQESLKLQAPQKLVSTRPATEEGPTVLEVKEEQRPKTGVKDRSTAAKTEDSKRPGTTRVTSSTKRPAAIKKEEKKFVTGKSRTVGLKAQSKTEAEKAAQEEVKPISEVIEAVPEAESENQKSPEEHKEKKEEEEKKEVVVETKKEEGAEAKKETAEVKKEQPQAETPVKEEKKMESPKRTSTKKEGKKATPKITTKGKPTTASTKKLASGDKKGAAAAATAKAEESKSEPAAAQEKPDESTAKEAAKSVADGVAEKVAKDLASGDPAKIVEGQESEQAEGEGEAEEETKKKEEEPTAATTTAKSQVKSAKQVTKPLKKADDAKGKGKGKDTKAKSMKQAAKQTEESH